MSDQVAFYCLFFCKGLKISDVVDVDLMAASTALFRGWKLTRIQHLSMKSRSVLLMIWKVRWVVGKWIV